MTRAYRRQGVATALLRDTFAAIYGKGWHSITLHVDADSLTGATRLYEKVGMYVEHEYTSYEKELRAGRDLQTRTVED